MKKNKHIVVLIAALSLLITSCDKELENKELTGEVVPVQVHLLGMSAGGSEGLLRSSAQREMKRVTEPVGNGMLLEMSIEEDEPPLRGLVKLADNTHFRVIAIESTSKKVYTYGDFVSGSGVNSLSTFYVHVGSTYDFICISYNNQTLPSHTYTKGSVLPEFSGVSNTKDLLFWTKKNVTVNTAADVELQIELDQKLTKIRALVNCTYNEWKISAVASNKISIATINTTGTMNWETGAVTATGNASTPYFTWSTPASPYPTSHPSNELIIIPKASSEITVTIAANAISRAASTSVPSAEKTIKFTEALAAGVNYTIHIRVRTPRMAGSNIYWKWKDDEDGDPNTHLNGGYLTFDEEGHTTNEGYQGVHFRWGSLVGISPAQTEVPASSGTMTDAFLSTTPVYIPTYNAAIWTNSTWVASTTHGYTAAGWKEPKASDVDDPEIIPYMDGRSAFKETNNTRSSTFLIDAERNTDEMYSARRGDICQYLSKTGAVSGDYRLPTSLEFGPGLTSTWNVADVTLPNKDGWIKGLDPWPVQNSAAGYADGTANMLIASKNGGNTVYGSAINVPMGNIVFSASGSRDIDGALIIGDNNYGGCYWSGSTNNSNYTNAYFMNFATTIIAMSAHTRRSKAFAVRCVLK